MVQLRSDFPDRVGCAGVDATGAAGGRFADVLRDTLRSGEPRRRPGLPRRAAGTYPTVRDESARLFSSINSTRWPRPTITPGDRYARSEPIGSAMKNSSPLPLSSGTGSRKDSVVIDVTVPSLTFTPFRC